MEITRLFAIYIAPLLFGEANLRFLVSLYYHSYKKTIELWTFYKQKTGFLYKYPPQKGRRQNASGGPYMEGENRVYWRANCLGMAFISSTAPTTVRMVSGSM